MGKYWCKHCAVFVDESKRGKLQHEISTRHKRSIQSSITKLHNVNRTASQANAAAQKELDRINRALGTALAREPLMKKEGTKQSVTVGSPSTTDPKVAGVMGAQPTPDLSLQETIPLETTMGKWEEVLAEGECGVEKLRAVPVERVGPSTPFSAKDQAWTFKARTAPLIDLDDLEEGSLPVKKLAFKKRKA